MHQCNLVIVNKISLWQPPSYGVMGRAPPPSALLFATAAYLQCRLQVKFGFCCDWLRLWRRWSKFSLYHELRETNLWKHSTHVSLRRKHSSVVQSPTVLLKLVNNIVWLTRSNRILFCQIDWMVGRLNPHHEYLVVVINIRQVSIIFHSWRVSRVTYAV